MDSPTTQTNQLATRLTSLPLFDGCNLPSQRPTEDPLEARRRAENAAFEKADERWRMNYWTWILRYLERFGPSTAEQIRVAYEKTPLPQATGSKRASGAIFRALMKEGLIRKIGKEQSNLYGNDLNKYELTK